jgi:Phosphoribosylaminoimidazole carboxylase (NCAIR synthetase)
MPQGRNEEQSPARNAARSHIRDVADRGALSPPPNEGAERLSDCADGLCGDNGGVAANGAARLLVLGAGPAQLGILGAARRRGLTVVAADRDALAPGFQLADRRAVVSIEDEPAIERLARAEEAEGIVTAGTDHAVAIAARIAHRLGLPHPLTPEVAQLAVSKQRQRERLAQAGIAQPRSMSAARPRRCSRRPTSSGTRS